MTPEADRWLADLASRLPRHGRLLRALTESSERDPRIRTLMVGCSIGRGAGDELSDIDAHAQVVDAAWPDAVEAVERMARGAGDPVEVLVHRLPDVAPETHRHVFVQYSDGVQLSLVVQPVSAQSRRGRAPDVVALHDPDDRLGIVVEPRGASATAEELHEWCVLGWQALDDVVKYVRRGSPWEALERLHAARTQVWRLWAADEGVASPAHGVTSILDTPGARLPPGIEATVPVLSVDGIAAAARACASLLSAIAREQPPIAGFVSAKLRDVPAESS